MEFPKKLNNDGTGSMIIRDENGRPVAEMLAHTSSERDEMAAEIIRRWNAFKEPTERREYDASSVTYVLAIDGREYSRRVEIETQVDSHYGADIDGRRGTPVRFSEVSDVKDDPPALDSPHRDEWGNIVPSEDSLLDDWADNYTEEI